jgi:hypothetical protein
LFAYLTTCDASAQLEVGLFVIKTSGATDEIYAHAVSGAASIKTGRANTKFSRSANVKKASCPGIAA